MLKKWFSRRKKKRSSILPEHVVTAETHGLIKDDIDGNTLKVLDRLQSKGYEAYLVGGGVRDLLLRQAPKDFDVATNAKPPEIRKLFRNCRLIGRRFRLAHILYGRDIVEVATFRAPPPKKTKHHETSESGMVVRDNVYGSFEDDVWRRDFTVNALYFDAKEENIIDLTNGITDLKNKLLRIIGDPHERFLQDPVILLRAIRFAAKLDFTIEKNTAELIPKDAHLLSNVSNARLQGEVIKLFQSQHAKRSLDLLIDYHLLAELFPSTNQALKDVDTPYMENLLTITCENTDNRLKGNKPVTPAFLFASFLWQPFLHEYHQLKKQHKKTMMWMLHEAMNTVIHAQHQITTISKHHARMIKEIWFLQFRLVKRLGKRPYRCLNHPKFRAGYDFLAIRAQSGEVPLSLAHWWEDFQNGDPETQERLCQEVANEKPILP